MEKRTYAYMYDMLVDLVDNHECLKNLDNIIQSLPPINIHNCYVLVENFKLYAIVEYSTIEISQEFQLKAFIADLPRIS